MRYNIFHLILKNPHQQGGNQLTQPTRPPKIMAWLLFGDHVTWTVFCPTVRSKMFIKFQVQILVTIPFGNFLRKRQQRAQMTMPKYRKKYRQNIVTISSKYCENVVKISSIDDNLKCYRQNIVKISSIDNNPCANDNRERK